MVQIFLFVNFRFTESNLIFFAMADSKLSSTVFSEDFLPGDFNATIGDAIKAKSFEPGPYTAPDGCVINPCFDRMHVSLIQRTNDSTWHIVGVRTKCARKPLWLDYYVFQHEGFIHITPVGGTVNPPLYLSKYRFY